MWSEIHSILGRPLVFCDVKATTIPILCIYTYVKTIVIFKNLNQIMVVKKWSVCIRIATIA